MTAGISILLYRLRYMMLALLKILQLFIIAQINTCIHIEELRHFTDEHNALK